ncbi:hypothetical protein JMN32_03510 [Fulvivirga sp. 29W222]|uniref:Uncharacterized protein n=1 Tax=Fulvivirga marina TaxID=2494733 RepID=A0A937FTH4_9BACT|nr:hypothetical protein [Fulvivirga marina]MBL6445359.1 hypothetical protein [Fulvivirga marina]
MSKIKIYHDQYVYYLLQGGNVAVFNNQLKMVRHQKALKWLTSLNHVFIPEILPETEEYNLVLKEYKKMIDQLPQPETKHQHK